ncbi:hypothetical protein BELL_0592g00070 [Botrytis elliptica]|uniref:Uncharacterized protein n=1 Tax=Botrytis elliptica TaxID=278938 RepID=A0A4Z1JCN3_9HELO|nr:hypothetical protein BELL_0592g00070 [Botrytis elliptica]
MGGYVLLGSETEYLWRQWTKKWSLSSIPDPEDPDPVRCAIVACIVEELVRAFNWRLVLGMRHDGKHIRRKNEGDPYPPYTPVVGPDWTRSVPPIEPDMLKDLPSEMVVESELNWVWKNVDARKTSQNGLSSQMIHEARHTSYNQRDSKCRKVFDMSEAVTMLKSMKDARSLAAEYHRVYGEEAFA